MAADLHGQSPEHRAPAASSEPGFDPRTGIAPPAGIQPRLGAAVLWTRPDGTPGGAPIRSDWLAVLESSLPSEFFERAPFDRVALWLHVAPADSQPGARAPADRWYLLEGDRTGTEWLDVELELPAAVCRARNPSHREALVAGAVLGGLAEVARRFALPARSLRRARQRQLTRVPLRRRV